MGAAAYVQEFNALAQTWKAVDAGGARPRQRAIPDNRDALWSFVAPAGPDRARVGTQFGAVVAQPRRAYKPGETAVARFMSANPRCVFLSSLGRARSGTKHACGAGTTGGPGTRS